VDAEAEEADGALKGGESQSSAVSYVKRPELTEKAAWRLVHPARLAPATELSDEVPVLDVKRAPLALPPELQHLRERPLVARKLGELALRGVGDGDDLVAVGGECGEVGQGGGARGR
jgi:hypothetical protein